MDKILDINGFQIGGDECYVIADIGSNHGQDLSVALDTIEAAAESGAHAVKFQSLNQFKLYFDPSDEVKQLYDQIDLNEEWYYALKSKADECGITFFSSPTYMDSIRLLEELDVPIYKLASAQIGVFPQIVEKVANLGKPVILSTGLVSYGELETIYDIFRRAGNSKMITLHCNAIYPTPHEGVMMGLMDTYKSMLDCIVGFSDHTLGNYATFSAVARGAKVIERHFTISKSIKTPDLVVSLDPSELREMTDGIKAIEATLNNFMPRVNIHKSEMNFKKSIAYKVFAKEEIKEGKPLSECEFEYLRYDQGLDCTELFHMSMEDYVFTTERKAGELIQIEDLKKIKKQ